MIAKNQKLTADGSEVLQAIQIRQPKIGTNLKLTTDGSEVLQPIQIRQPI